MGRRQMQLQQLLLSLDPGMTHAYYQPREGMRLIYPCIVYNQSDKPTKFANNMPYGWDDVYTLTYISTTPDDHILDVIGMLPKCQFDRTFVNDNLYHYVYNINY